MALVLIARAVKLAGEYLKKNPGKVSEIGKVLGKETMSLKNILKRMRESPWTTSLVLAELYHVIDGGFELFDEVLSDNPDIAAYMNDKYNLVIDEEPSMSQINDIEKYRDEFEAIDRVNRALGITQVDALRTALKIPDGTWMLYQRQKGI